MNDIGRQVRELERARREYQREVMAEYDKEHYRKLAALRAQCDHQWHFSHLGPINHPWFYCSVCGKSEMREE